MIRQNGFVLWCLEWTEIHGAKVPRADLVLFNLQLSQHFELKSHIH